MSSLLPPHFDKNIVMCITTGRSGTTLLEQLVALADDTCAVHEPEPTFHKVPAEQRHDLAVASAYVKDIKLPDILRRAADVKNYVETSHMFGKGFFEAFVALGIPFRIVILDRNPREVAKSLWRVKTIPGRTKRGRIFLLDPAQEEVMKLPRWNSMSDYALCYWYCLEMERRKLHYTREAARLGIPVTKIFMDDLVDWDTFRQFCTDIGLILPESKRAQYNDIVKNKVNRKPGHWPKFSLLPIAFHEKRVWKELKAPDLYAHVHERYKGKAGGSD